MNGKSKCFSFVCIVLLLFALYPPIAYSINQGQLLGINAYLKRTFSNIHNGTKTFYQELSLQAPTNITPITQIIVSPYEERRHLGDWISPLIYSTLDLNRFYNFLFSFWGYGTVSSSAQFEIKLYIWAYEEIEIPLTNRFSYYLSNVTFREVLWQSRTIQNIHIDLGVRLVLKVWMICRNSGTYYFRYDGINYPSYFTDPTETRYFRNDEVLGTAQTTNIDTIASIYSGKRTAYFHFRIYVVHADSSTTELTSGWTSHSARSSNGEGYITTNWNCPQTSLVTTDKIRVDLRVYVYTTSSASTKTFLTEELGATQLDSATWSIILYTYRLYDGVDTYGNIFHGIADYNSRITNFQWTSGQIYKYYHSIQINLVETQMRKGIFQYYSSIQINLAISEFKRGIFQIYSSLVIPINLAWQKSSLYQIFSKLSINLHLNQFIPFIEEFYWLPIYLLFIISLIGIILFLVWKKDSF